MVDVVQLGRRIKETRKLRNLTQEKLAELINKDVGFVGRIETGDRGVSLDTLIDIANVLDVTADELLIDSLRNDLQPDSKLYNKLLEDCSSFERQVIVETSKSLKDILRGYKYLQNCRK